MSKAWWVQHSITSQVLWSHSLLGRHCGQGLAPDSLPSVISFNLPFSPSPPPSQNTITTRNPSTTRLLQLPYTSQALSDLPATTQVLASRSFPGMSFCTCPWPLASHSLLKVKSHSDPLQRFLWVLIRRIRSFLFGLSTESSKSLYSFPDTTVLIPCCRSASLMHHADWRARIIFYSSWTHFILKSAYYRLGTQQSNGWMDGINLNRGLITHSRNNSRRKLLSKSTINCSRIKDKGISSFKKKTFKKESMLTGTFGPEWFSTHTQFRPVVIAHWCRLKIEKIIRSI